MSDRLRAAMRHRRGEMTDEQEQRIIGGMIRPIDSDIAQEDLQAQLENAQKQNNLSPIRVDDDLLKQVYTGIFGSAMASQILDQYMSGHFDLPGLKGHGDTPGVSTRPMVPSIKHAE